MGTTPACNHADGIAKGPIAGDGQQMSRRHWYAIHIHNEISFTVIGDFIILPKSYTADVAPFVFLLHERSEFDDGIIRLANKDQIYFRIISQSFFRCKGYMR